MIRLRTILVQYLGELGEEIVVKRNDEIDLDGIAALSTRSYSNLAGTLHAE